MKEVIMKALRYSVPVSSLLAATSLLWSGSAHAHFKLLSPDSWLKEASDGAPQKGGPCGPGGADDVQPVPMSMKVTEVHAGDTIMVAFDETIHHPGWFRISLAEDPKDFKDPDFPNANCTVDMSTVPTEPHGNVLVDGLGMNSDLAGDNRKFMEMVTLPDKACEKCTLQVIQVMADAIHSPPGCVYHHCADIKILPKDGAAAAAGSGAAGGGASATAGSSASGGSGAAAGSGGSTAAASGGSAAPAGAAAGAKATAAAGGSSASSTSASGSAGKAATSTGSGGTTGSSSTTAKAGSAAPSTGSTTSPSTSSDSSTGAASGSSGGCVVSGAAANANGASFALLTLAGLFLGGRRKRQ